MARGHASPRAFYVDKLAEGVATIAAAFWPKPVIVRLSDFKSNEYKKLIGGCATNPKKKTPCWASVAPRVTSARNSAKPLPWSAKRLKRVRNDMGLTNVEIMVPFVRTLKQAERVTGMLADHGLVRALPRRQRRPARHHDVRSPPTPSWPSSSWSSSTACPSAPTT